MTARWTLAAVLAATLAAQPTLADPAAGPVAELPADAADYVVRRAGCNHWTGEDAYDEERGREIAAVVETLRCEEIDAQEKTLRQRYRKDPAVLRAFDKAADTDG